jgi:quinol monooxygenase YgiN
MQPLKGLLMAILVTGYVECVAGRTSMLESAVEALAIPTRQEPGCEAYGFYRDIESDHCYVWVERWKDRSTFDSHVESPHMRTFLATSGHLLASSQILVHEVIQTEKVIPNVLCLPIEVEGGGGDFRCQPALLSRVPIRSRHGTRHSQVEA